MKKDKLKTGAALNDRIERLEHFTTLILSGYDTIEALKCLGPCLPDARAHLSVWAQKALGEAKADFEAL